MKKLLALPMLAACCAGQVPAQQAKVGIIQIQAAVTSTKDGQKASAELEGKFAPKRKEVEGKQAQINALKDQLQKGQNTMSEAAKAELARNIDLQSKRLNREMDDAQAEITQDEQKALQTIFQRMQAVINKYAKDNGYTLILDVSGQQQPVLFASNGADITRDIIDLYDKNSTGTASPAPVAPASTPKPVPPAPKPTTPPTKPN